MNAIDLYAIPSEPLAFIRYAHDAHAYAEKQLRTDRDAYLTERKLHPDSNMADPDWHRDVNVMYRRVAEALELAVICGGSESVVKFGVGCGQPISSVEELYRCAQCDTPMHGDCLKRHFGPGDGPVPTQVEAWAMRLRAHDERRIALEQIAKKAQEVVDEYPAIAGRVIALQHSGEEKAEKAWLEIARKVHALSRTLAELPLPQAQDTSTEVAS